MNLSELGVSVKIVTDHTANPDSIYLCIVAIVEQTSGDRLTVQTLKKIFSENLHLDSIENQSLLIRHYLNCRKNEDWMSKNKTEFTKMLLLSDEDYTSTSKYFFQLFNNSIVKNQIWPDLCFLPYLFRILAHKAIVKQGFLIVLINEYYDVMGTFEAGAAVESDQMIVFRLDRENVTIDVVSINDRIIHTYEHIRCLDPPFIDGISKLELSVDQIENLCKVASERSIPMQIHTSQNVELAQIMSHLTEMKLDDEMSQKKYTINPLTGRKIVVGGKIWSKLEKSRQSKNK